MFTGLVTNISNVLDVKTVENGLQINIYNPFSDIELGESIAINGVCLTVMSFDNQSIRFDVSYETLSKTNFDSIKPHDKVNVERAMLANTRFGGHYVSGHVDTTKFITNSELLNEYLSWRVGGFNQTEKQYLIPKGSICIDGVSLTINAIHNDEIEILLIPHTQNNTALTDKSIGSRVNIEFDYLSKIIFHQIQFMKGDISL